MYNKEGNKGNMQDKVLLEVKNLKKYFPVKGKHHQKVHAVDDVSFNIEKGETFGLVGESGCGKSTLARTIIRIYDPTSGSIILNGTNIAEMGKRQLKPIRKNMQMIFQDPYSSLNTRMTVFDIIAEPLIAQGIIKKASEARKQIIDILDCVGLNEEHCSRYPHEFSGGQRQRIGIARALILKPQIIICDEPISALDVSIQAQVVNLLQELQKELGLTYLFIAHDLSMVRYVSDRVGVMYLGKLVEVCDSAEIYSHPLHPYTKGLLEAVPVADPVLAKQKKDSALKGDIISPINPPDGCRFHTRCIECMEICKTVNPQLRDTGGKHFVACHLFNK